MHILHLCSDYSRQRLYKNFVESLSLSGIKQTVYVPVRTQAEIGKYNPEKENIFIYYDFILRKADRLFYQQKINKIYKSLAKKIDFNDYSVTHAHFLFSDGGAAQKIKKKHGIPYIVAVRNTDVNFFFKYMIHLRKKGFKILKEAENIIFITPMYINSLKKYLGDKNFSLIKHKIKIIPNGLDNFWIENKTQKSKTKLNNPIRILYVGDLSLNKNLKNTIEAINLLNKSGQNYQFTVVGDGGNGAKLTKKLFHQFDYVNYLGKISDLQTLLNHYKKANIFVMPSKKETFGIVFLESMSQSTPVIYSKGQGIDGYFLKNMPGTAVEAFSVKSIAEGIRKIESNYTYFSKNCLSHIDEFSWKNISNKYIEIYKKIPV